jgi:hypothetical protein
LLVRRDRERGEERIGRFGEECGGAFEPARRARSPSRSNRLRSPSRRSGCCRVSDDTRSAQRISTLDRRRKTLHTPLCSRGKLSKTAAAILPGAGEG